MHKFDYNNSIKIKFMKHYFEEFQYCPKCGQKYDSEDFYSEDTFFACKMCGFKFFQNSKPAVAVIIPNAKNKSEILLAQRAIDPNKGMLDLPGGFLKYAENPMEGAIREVKEELNMDIKIEELFFIANANYLYQGVYNNVVSIFFIAQSITSMPANINKEENFKCDFYNLADIVSHPEKIAFGADLEALKKYAEILNKK